MCMMRACERGRSKGTENFDESLNRSNRSDDNYSDDDNNKSNNDFISVQSRIKSLLNGGEGWPERKSRPRARARAHAGLTTINTHYMVGAVFVNSSGAHTV